MRSTFLVCLLISACTPAPSPEVLAREVLWTRAIESFHPGRIDTFAEAGWPDTLLDTSYVVLMAHGSFDSGLVRRSWAQGLVDAGTLLAICDTAWELACPTRSAARHLSISDPVPAGGDTVRLVLHWLDVNPTKCAEGIGSAYSTGRALYFVRDGEEWREVERPPRRPPVPPRPLIDGAVAPDVLPEVLFLSGDMWCASPKADSGIAKDW